MLLRARVCLQVRNEFACLLVAIDAVGVVRLTDRRRAAC